MKIFFNSSRSQYLACVVSTLQAPQNDEPERKPDRGWSAQMYKTKNIMRNAVNSKDHTTLVAAVKAAGLVETLAGPGPFTVFAPVNSAFDILPGRYCRNTFEA